MRSLVRRDLIGLNYHIVTDSDPKHVRHVNPFKSVSQFEADLVFIKKHLTVVSYDEAERIRNERYERPGRPSFLITFDDGFRECLTEVIPLLRKHDLPAVFFVTTDFVGNRGLFYRNAVSLCCDHLLSLTNKAAWSAVQDFRDFTDLDFFEIRDVLEWLLSLGLDDLERIETSCELLGIDPEQFLREQRPYLSPEEIAEIDSEQFRIGAHSCSHRHLGKFDRLDNARREICESCRIVTEITGRQSVPFAFPFSGSYVPVEFIEKLRKETQHLGLLFDSRGLLKNSPSIVHRIPCDRPASAVTESSNLSRLLRSAYQKRLRDQIKNCLAHGRRR